MSKIYNGRSYSNFTGHCYTGDTGGNSWQGINGNYNADDDDDNENYDENYDDRLDHQEEYNRPKRHRNW